MLHVGRVWRAGFLLVATAILFVAPALAEDSPQVELKKLPGKVEITVGGKPFATYIYSDPKISRPYFAHVHAPSGTQVTRNHPPVAGDDKMDHPEFHPGIWMAFGDISGNDYWRLKAPVEHLKFVMNKMDDTFAVRNRYVAASDPSDLICEEVCRFRVVPTPQGNLLTWDSSFTSVHEFTFGDQEEMGLGIRVATPLRVEAGYGSLPAGNGTMTDSEGRKNGAEIGGNSADWCDYSGTLEGTPLFLGCSENDPHIPRARLEETADVFESLGAQVTFRLYHGVDHGVNRDEIDFIGRMMTALI